MDGGSGLFPDGDIVVTATRLRTDPITGKKYITPYRDLAEKWFNSLNEFQRCMAIAKGVTANETYNLIYQGGKYGALIGRLVNPGGGQAAGAGLGLIGGATAAGAIDIYRKLSQCT